MYENIHYIHLIAFVFLHILIEDLSEIVLADVLVIFIEASPIFITFFNLSLVILYGLDTLSYGLAQHLVGDPSLILKVGTLV
jgi:hypothetical protein